jgi:hypothetical protein
MNWMQFAYRLVSYYNSKVMLQNPEIANEARQHASQSELLRTELMSLLASSAISKAIGAERACRMADTAKQMGVVALGGLKAKVYKDYGIAASNGVYIALHPHDMSGARFRIPYESFRKKWEIPLPVHGYYGGASHSTFKELPGLHLITMPVDTAGNDAAARAVLAAHELTHVDQAKGRLIWGHVGDPYEQAANEAEAYEVQFRIHDSMLGGVLSEVAKASIDHGAIIGESKTIVVPEDLVLPDGREWLTEVEAASVINGAYHMLYGYSLEAADTVSREIVEAYTSDNKLSRLI